MSERPKYYSPEYYAQLEELAERLVTPDRFGKVALNQLVLFGPDGLPVDDDEPEIGGHIQLGED